MKVHLSPSKRPPSLRRPRRPLRSLGFVGLTVCFLAHCEKPQDPVPETDAASTPTAAAVPQDEPVEKSRLQDIIRGVWQSSDTSDLDDPPEKIELDFRADGEVTMTIYNRGRTQQNGRYVVEGDNLQLTFEGQEEDDVQSTFDGTSLTIIDGRNDYSVPFHKL